jgi:hypothetical protein
MAMRQLSIREVTNGFIVEVGCMTLVFATFEALKNELIAYNEDSQIVERKWLGVSEEKNIRTGEMPDQAPQPNDEVSRRILHGGTAQVAVRGDSSGLDR